MRTQQQKQPDPKPAANRPHTKWGWLRWGLRWFSVGVFALAFCAGLLLSVSWKMLICLAVIPVTAIFFPQKVKSWVWVCLTGILLGLFIWVLLPEMNKENWTPYQFNDELETLNNDHLPAGIANAADRYQTLLDEHGETILLHGLPVEDQYKTHIAPWDPQNHPELNTWLNTFEPGIQRLIEIAEMEHCRFAIPHDMSSLDMQMQRISRIKGWVRWLIRSANRDIYLGRTEQALAKLLSIPRMAQHLYQQKTLFDQAAAFHVELIGVRILEAFMIEQCDDPNMLEQIEQTFIGLDPQWPGNWPKILAREKLMIKNIAGNLYEVSRKGRIRMSRNAIPALGKGLGFYVPYMLRKQNLSKAATIGLWVFMPSSPEGIGRMIDERFDHYSRQVQRGEQLPKISSRHDLMLRGMNYKSIIDWRAMEQVQYYWALDGQFRRHQAIVRRIRILSALKQHFLKHKRWPDQLTELEIDDPDDALIDPLCGKPFFYERLNDGFRLYSLGPNGVDDGGLRDPDEKKDDILIWPGIYTEKETGGEIVDE